MFIQLDLYGNPRIRDHCNNVGRTIKFILAAGKVSWGRMGKYIRRFAVVGQLEHLIVYFP